MALGALSPRMRWPLGSTWSHIFDPVKSLHFEFVSMLIERQLKSNWAGCSRERWAPPVKTHLQSFNFFGILDLPQPCAHGKASQNQLMGPVPKDKMATAWSIHIFSPFFLDYGFASTMCSWIGSLKSTDGPSAPE